jgi:ribosomal protein L37E
MDNEPEVDQDCPRCGRHGFIEVLDEDFSGPLAFRELRCRACGWERMQHFRLTRDSAALERSGADLCEALRS